MCLRIINVAFLFSFLSARGREGRLLVTGEAGANDERGWAEARRLDNPGRGDMAGARATAAWSLGLHGAVVRSLRAREARQGGAFAVWQPTRRRYCL
jgi:hypothetical protein